MNKPVSINLLENLQIASPCTARWEEMAGNDRSRYCNECHLNVYNLSAMTRQEANSFIQGASGRACVRLYRRSDGTVITQDCPTGVRMAHQRLVRSVRNIAAAVVALAAGIVGFGGKPGRRAWFTTHGISAPAEYYSPGEEPGEAIQGAMPLDDRAIRNDQFTAPDESEPDYESTDEGAADSIDAAQPYEAPQPAERPEIR